MYNWAYSTVRAKKMSREEVKIQRDLAKSSGWQIINHRQYFIYKNKDFTWKNMRFCQVVYLLNFSRLGFYLIKVYIYVKFLIH